MSTSPPPGVREDHSRRDFIKRTAVVGSVVWATPAIVTMGKAAAGSPACVCTSSAVALLATGRVLGVAVNVGPLGQPQQPCPISVGGPGSVIRATGLCSQTDSTGAECRASSVVATLEIPAIGFEARALQSSATAPCNCASPSGTASIAFLRVLGTTIVASVLTPPQNTVLLNGSGVMIIANRQTCAGGARTVDALFVRVSQPALGTDLTVTVAESMVHASNCTAC